MLETCLEPSCNNAFVVVTMILLNVSRISRHLHSARSGELHIYLPDFGFLRG